MNYLLINKFLHPNGGSETYIFELGKYIQSQGHNVQYFGMEHEGRIVGNQVNAYTSDMDFHGGSIFKKLSYPIKTIYSSEARKKIRQVLDDFKPDVCHINNFNYQLTPSIILEIVKWRKDTNRDCKIIFTAHDYQLICPNHMLYNDGSVCEQCISKGFGSCSKNRCIHGSRAKSIIGEIEAKYWNNKNVYQYFDKIICPSEFLKIKMDSNAVFRYKTVAIHNFTNKASQTSEKVSEASKGYILYLGRLSKEKGVDTLIKAAEKLPDIKFIMAGTGPLADMLQGISNIEYVGFKTGDELIKLIKEAVCSVYPSTWYENCPLSVMESISYGTPVIGANIGGIPELIDDGKTGVLFEPGNVDDLVSKIRLIAENKALAGEYTENCLRKKYLNVEEYFKEFQKVTGI